MYQVKRTLLQQVRTLSYCLVNTLQIDMRMHYVFSTHLMINNQRISGSNEP